MTGAAVAGFGGGNVKVTDGIRADGRGAAGTVAMFVDQRAQLMDGQPFPPANFVEGFPDFGLQTQTCPALADGYVFRKLTRRSSSEAYTSNTRSLNTDTPILWSNLKLNYF